MSVSTDLARYYFEEDTDRMCRSALYGLTHKYSITNMLYKFMIIKALEINDDNSHYTTTEREGLESIIAQNCDCLTCK